MVGRKIVGRRRMGLRNMNRRNFIRNVSIAAMGIPVISTGITFQSPQLESIQPSGNFIDILSIEELKRCGIRAAHYSANCVDKNGVFGHERGYQDLWVRDSEPFVRKLFVLKSTPQIWVYNETSVKSVAHTRAHNSYMNAIISEIKEHMEYVCLVAYLHCPAVPTEAWPEKFMPVVGGLSKVRYQQYLKQLNR